MTAMAFPVPVRLTTADGVIDFPAGINEVPVNLADHPYLAAHGAIRATGDEDMEQLKIDHHVQFSSMARAQRAAEVQAGLIHPAPKLRNGD